LGPLQDVEERPPSTDPTTSETFLQLLHNENDSFLLKTSLKVLE